MPRLMRFLNLMALFAMVLTVQLALMPAIAITGTIDASGRVKAFSPDLHSTILRVEKLPDDYVACWPQSAVEVRDYDETPEAGTLRLKAEDYDIWHETWHQPYYGGNVHAYFTDDTYTEVAGYHGMGDSCIWTGTYLGSEALRYWVTGDAQARMNVINMVHVLDGYLRVNGKPGFISRYWGSQDGLNYHGDEWCDDPVNDRCHRIEEGEFAGDYWWGETSRDQYTGWFYGMVLAYDHVDDEPMRDVVRAAVAEVLDELIATNWWIIDEAGEISTKAPQVLPKMQLTWLTIGYHVTGEERFRTELQTRLKNLFRIKLRLSSIAFFNRYAQYYGNNLSHTNWFNLLRLGRVYFSRADYKYLRFMFETTAHTFTRLSHNPWFNAIFMAQGIYDPGQMDDPYADQLVEDLDTFRWPPNYDYHVPARDPATYELDPTSVKLHDLQEQYPILEEIMGGVEYQALEAFPVDLQCPSGFRFQRNPFQFDACGSGDVTQVHSGHDYLAAYWMGAYYGNLTKGQ